MVGSKFFPDATGAISESSLTAAADKATSKLARHAANLLFVKGINYPMNGPTDCGHAQGLCQALTARPAGGGGKTATSTGPSADVVIAERLNPGVDPLTLYAGNKRNGYIVERLSFKDAGAGQVRAADDNPYNLYAQARRPGFAERRHDAGCRTRWPARCVAAARASTTSCASELAT